MRQAAGQGAQGAASARGSRPAAVAPGERIPGLLLCLLGLWVVWQGVRLRLGSWVDPGPGMFPAVVGVLLAAVGGLLALKPPPAGPGEAGSLWEAGKGAALTLGFVLALPVLGMAPSLALFMAAWVRWVGGRPWRQAVGAALVVALGGVGLFRELFQVPLPVWPALG